MGACKFLIPYRISIDISKNRLNWYTYSLSQTHVHSLVECRFAYGQTSTGKTYTMNGTSDLPGIIPLAIEDVFTYIAEHPEREFLLRVSYMEIYNEVRNQMF